MPTTPTPAPEVRMATTLSPVAVVRELDAMLDGIAAAEQVSRDFAAQFPTPSVLRGIALAESGRITWVQMAKLAEQALAAGIAAVAK